MAGFRYRKNAYALPAQEVEHILINNSVTIKVGGLVRIVTSGSPTAGNGVVCEDVAATETIYGLCEGIVTKDGIPLEGSDSSTYDGTIASSGVWGAHSYTASASNLTGKQVKAVVRPLRRGDLLSNATDGTFGTSTGSKTRFNFSDLADDVSVDENAGSVTAIQQMCIWGADPDDSSLGLYTPEELQIHTSI